ncbi:MAG: DUF5012 domain-containing protein [Saprospiraceae bacterium]|nr:DUF5012 domain-containing protein [Saprospiraceae bacterium]
MKLTQYSILLLTGIALFLSACTKTDIVDSEVTYLPKIDVVGGSSIQLACDATSFTDPGASATEGGVDVALTTSIHGNYFGSSAVDGPDEYVVNYSAVNKDGIPGAAMRTILWPECNGDLVTSIAGMYSMTVERNGNMDPQYKNNKYFFMKDLGGGQYQLSDAIGGYYDKGRGYGPDYAATGFVVTANDIPNNDFTHDGTIGVGAFGGNLIMTAFSVNPATRTINFTTDWDFGYVFVVTLTQIDL